MNIFTKFGILFYLLGVLNICFEIYFSHRKTQIYKEGVRVTAKVISVKKSIKYKSHINVSLLYSFHGKEYEAEMNKIPSTDFRKIKGYFVYVDPNDPSEYTLGEPEMPIPLGGIFLTLFGFLMMYPAYQEEKKFRHLKRKGKIISSKILYVGPNENYHDSEFGHPFKVEAEFIDPVSGKSIMVSENILWKDPIHSGLISPDQTVEVLYDPKNPKICMIIMKEFSQIKKAS
jgi:hypothetical protein